MSCYRTAIPSPVLLVVTRPHAGGVVNIAPISWVSLVGGKPPRLVLCALNRHDTCRNLLAFGELTVNVPNSSLQREIAACAAELPPTTSENDLAHLSLLASCHVAVPIIGECRSNLECVVKGASDIGASTLFICEVLAAYIDQGISGSDRDVFLQVGGLVYVGGDDCATIGEILPLDIPKVTGHAEGGR